MSNSDFGDGLKVGVAACLLVSCFVALAVGLLSARKNHEEIVNALTDCQQALEICTDP